MSILAIKKAYALALSAENFSELMPLLYLAVYMRQYFWAWSGISVWIVSVFAAGIVLAALSAGDGQEKPQGHGVDWLFGLLVLVPLASVYMWRLPFPDESWDIINYHYLNGERAVNGCPYIDGDFLYLMY
jgi:hypothetical protein